MNSKTTDNETTATAGQSVGHWFQQMPLTRVHWVAGLVLFFSFVIESWEMMIIIFNSGSIGAEFNLGTAQIGRLISAMFLGMIPGALLWGKLVDRFGRKTCLVWSLALYWPLPLLSAFATGFEMLWWLRAVGGVVLSGALVVTFRRTRGRPGPHRRHHRFKCLLFTRKRPLNGRGAHDGS